MAMGVGVICGLLIRAITSYSHPQGGKGSGFSFMAKKAVGVLCQ